jgi:hypothetical protein
MALSLGYPEETPLRGRLKLRQRRKPLADLLQWSDTAGGSV